MKTAIVTGASSGIGKKIAEVLSKNGYYVLAFGRIFDDAENENIKKICCDFMNINVLSEIITKIGKEYDVNVLVNCAGIAYYGLHEELNTKKINEMVAVNVTAPIVITQILLRNLKKTKGHIINISSVTAEKSNPYGACYGATKSALLSFSKSIFDEARKYGVKVTAVCPDMTETNLYRNANFETDKDELCYITPEEIAKNVLDILNMRINVSQITLQPQKHRISKKM